MIIRSAVFVISCPSLKECPASSKPEFAFIGRSNVGKSSLINMLAGRKGLAKISVQPGKTRTMNYFLINDDWHIVDLPGYGYARVPVDVRNKWIKSTENFILKRDNLVSLFVLIDVRVKPQKSDLNFMEFMGQNQVPFVRVFTKIDKISRIDVSKSIEAFDQEMLKTWESLPQTFTTSSVKGKGKEEILSFIEESINIFSNNRINRY
ncbi:MAG TPA: ribosome biogenesis GTP-binding protein YihA/YsxC [Bacteroidales bacterium]|nr:ribosome biogenesis GTP-binding protein YihA/YsxC [Bacteroidales bacterium]